MKGSTNYFLSPTNQYRYATIRTLLSTQTLLSAGPSPSRGSCEMPSTMILHQDYNFLSGHVMTQDLTNIITLIHTATNNNNTHRRRRKINTSTKAQLCTRCTQKFWKLQFSATTKGAGRTLLLHFSRRGTKWILAASLVADMLILGDKATNPEAFQDLAFGPSSLPSRHQGKHPDMLLLT